MSENNPTADNVLVDEEQKARPMEENLKSKPTWMRALFFLLYYILLSLASMVGTVVVVLGFLWVLFTGEVNASLRQVGQGIAAYMYEVIRYLTYNTDDRPFPFGSEWPSEKS